MGKDKGEYREGQNRYSNGIDNNNIVSRLDIPTTQQQDPILALDLLNRLGTPAPILYEGYQVTEASDYTYTHQNIIRGEEYTRSRINRLSEYLRSAGRLKQGQYTIMTGEVSACL